MGVREMGEDGGGVREVCSGHFVQPRHMETMDAAAEVTNEELIAAGPTFPVFVPGEQLTSSIWNIRSTLYKTIAEK